MGKNLIGAICSITNTENDKVLIISCDDVEEFQEKFEEAQQNSGSAPYAKLKKDWEKYGPDAFEFEVLEELEQEDGQATKAFKEELKELESTWKEHFDEEELY